jgi:hypothetical protein
MVSPHRPYPIFVYIFAIAIYELDPDMSQRRAAKITRYIFGLEKFSASTLCRTRQRLKDSTAEIAIAISEVVDKQIYDENDQVMDVLHQVRNHSEEYISALPGKPKVSAQATASGANMPSLKDAFKTFPYLVEFVYRHSSAKTMPLEEKACFSAYIGQLSRKYYLLNRRLIL